MKTQIEIVRNYASKALGELMVFQLPNVPISKIIIKTANTPVLDAHTLMPNHILEKIVLKVGAHDQEIWSGVSLADHVGRPTALRHLNWLDTGINLPDGVWELTFPDALPANVFKQLELTLESTSANYNDDDGLFTTFPYFDVLIETKDKIAGKTVMRKVSPLPRWSQEHPTYVVYFPSTQSTAGYRAMGLLMHFDDDGAIASFANLKTVKLKAFKNSQLIWSGTVKDLIQQNAQKSRIPIADTDDLGFAMLPLQGLVLNANDLKLEFTFDSDLGHIGIQSWFIEMAGL